MEELQRVIPNSEIRVRKGLDLKKIIPQAKEKGFTALIVVNEDRKVPSILSIFLRDFNNKQITNHLPLLSSLLNSSQIDELGSWCLLRLAGCQIP